MICLFAHLNQHSKHRPKRRERGKKEPQTGERRTKQRLILRRGRTRHHTRLGFGFGFGAPILQLDAIVHGLGRRANFENNLSHNMRVRHGALAQGSARSLLRDGLGGGRQHQWNSNVMNELDDGGELFFACFLRGGGAWRGTAFRLGALHGLPCDEASGRAWHTWTWTWSWKARRRARAFEKMNPNKRL